MGVVAAPRPHRPYTSFPLMTDAGGLKVYEVSCKVECFDMFQRYVVLAWGAVRTCPATHTVAFTFLPCVGPSHTRAWCRRYKYAMEDNLFSGV
jgi:hypothetical protein